MEVIKYLDLSDKTYSYDVENTKKSKGSGSVFVPAKGNNIQTPKAVCMSFSPGKLRIRCESMTFLKKLQKQEKTILSSANEIVKNLSKADRKFDHGDILTPIRAETGESGFSYSIELETVEPFKCYNEAKQEVEISNLKEGSEIACIITLYGYTVTKSCVVPVWRALQGKLYGDISPKPSEGDSFIRDDDMVSVMPAKEPESESRQVREVPEKKVTIDESALNAEERGPRPMRQYKEPEGVSEKVDPVELVSDYEDSDGDSFFSDEEM